MERRGLLDEFGENDCDKKYAELRPRHIRKLRDAMMERPGAANNLLKSDLCSENWSALPLLHLQASGSRGRPEQRLAASCRRAGGAC